MTQGKGVEEGSERVDTDIRYGYIFVVNMTTQVNPMKISLEFLLQGLVAKGNEIARASTATESDSRTPTSIRLKPATKHFLECQAEALNTSVQSLISMILDGVAEVTENRTAGTLRTIRERFFYLFEIHRIDLPGLISVMQPHGFTLSTLDSSARLLDLLDKKALQYLADTFFVQPEWLSGASDCATNLGVHVRWYKNTQYCAKKLIAYANAGLNPTVMFVRRQRADFDKARQDDDQRGGPEEPIGLVIRLERSTSDGVKFTVFETWEFGRWNYWRCREQIKLLICFCDQASAASRFSYGGYEIPEPDIEALKGRKPVAAALMQRVGSVAWYPEDYASLRFDVTKEVDDWALIRESYEKSGLPKLLQS